MHLLHDTVWHFLLDESLFRFTGEKQSKKNKMWNKRLPFKTQAHSCNVSKIPLTWQRAWASRKESILRCIVSIEKQILGLGQRTSVLKQFYVLEQLKTVSISRLMNLPRFWSISVKMLHKLSSCFHWLHWTWNISSNSSCQLLAHVLKWNFSNHASIVHFFFFFNAVVVTVSLRNSERFWDVPLTWYYILCLWCLKRPKIWKTQH